jgi:hypothetical protein
MASPVVDHFFYIRFVDSVFAKRTQLLHDLRQQEQSNKPDGIYQLTLRIEKARVSNARHLADLGSVKGLYPTANSLCSLGA